MKKSKHFRKDVIIARIIAATVLIVLIVLISSLISGLTKPEENTDKNPQKPSTEDVQNLPSTEPEVDVTENNEPEDTSATEDSSEPQSESESEPVSESESTSQPQGESRYVRTTAQVKFRTEPNTDCAVLGFIDMGTEVLLLEELNGWYKVSYDGKEGYISADYSRIVE